MGNLPSIQEKDFSRKPGSSLPPLPTTKVPYIKNLPPKDLAKLYPYLEKQAAKLGKRVDELNSKQGAWENEYTAIKDGDGQAAKLSLDPANANLNRYRNIVAYDKTRVSVEPKTYNLNNGYINANWVPGYKQKKGYIASQGPIPESIPSFWQMVWKTGVHVIVMVTNEIEGNKLKCHRYWPSRENPTELYGEVTVTMSSETVLSTYIHRIFQLQCDGTTAEIDHYQYTAWPDHGVPNTTSELLTFRKEIRKRHPHASAPLLVHCSAGVGRTGTFIVVDTLLNRIERLDSDLDVKKLVKHIRNSRNYLVQAVIQYQFCFRAILDAIEKALVKCVRAVESKKDEIKEMQFNLGELEGDIEEALDSYAGEQYGSDLLELGNQVSRGTRVDTRWEPYNASQDVSIAKNAVKPEVRVQSLQKASNQWKLRGDVPIGAEQHGYASPTTVALDQRVEALAMSASPDAWRKRYAEVAAQWVEEVYDVTASLNPLESRMMSLAGQKENWKLRGQAYRKQIEESTNSIVHDLTARLSSLSTTLQSSEERWRKKGDGFRGEAIQEKAVHTTDFGGSFGDRLNALINWVDPQQAKDRGTKEGREVENPEIAKKAAAEKMQKEEEEKRLRIEAMETEKREAEKKERAKREAEAKRKAEKPVKPTVSPNKNVDSVQVMVELSPTKKETKVHPMIAQSQQMAKNKRKSK